jgi:hypothetical protein
MGQSCSLETSVSISLMPRNKPEDGSILFFFNFVLLFLSDLGPDISVGFFPSRCFYAFHACQMACWVQVTSGNGASGQVEFIRRRLMFVRSRHRTGGAYCLCFLSSELVAPNICAF